MSVFTPSNGAEKQIILPRDPRTYLLTSLDDFGVSDFKTSEYQTLCDPLCHAGYSTPPYHTNAKMLGPRTEAHEEEGACAHKLHVCGLQPSRSV